MVSIVVTILCTYRAFLCLSINVTAEKLWKCMPIHACVWLIKDQPVGQQYSGGCIPIFDSPCTIHIKCYLSLWFWASRIQILDPRNHRHDYSIIDKIQAQLPAKNEIMHEFQFCVPLLYKYPYMCGMSTCLLYLLEHDVVSILYMILCLLFLKWRKKSK